MKQVYMARNPEEAHLVQGLLEAMGIGAEVRGEWLYGLRGEVPFTETFPTIWVQDADESQAHQIIKKHGE